MRCTFVHHPMRYMYNVHRLLVLLLTGTSPRRAELRIQCPALRPVRNVRCCFFRCRRGGQLTSLEGAPRIRCLAHLFRHRQHGRRGHGLEVEYLEHHYLVLC